MLYGRCMDVVTYGRQNVKWKDSPVLAKQLLPSRKIAEKQYGGVYFWLYGIAYCMPIQQKLPPPVLLLSDFAGWDASIEYHDLVFFGNNKKILRKRPLY